MDKWDGKERRFNVTDHDLLIQIHSAAMSMNKAMDQHFQDDKDYQEKNDKKLDGLETWKVQVVAVVSVVIFLIQFVPKISSFFGN